MTNKNVIFLSIGFAQWEENEQSTTLLQTYQSVSGENGRILSLFASNMITYMTFGVAEESRPRTNIVRIISERYAQKNSKLSIKTTPLSSRIFHCIKIS